MEDKDKEFKAKGLGTLELREATYNFKPDKNKLRASLPEGAGIIAFCSGCGAYFYLGSCDIQTLSKSLDIRLSPNDHYYEAQKCPFCDGKREGGVFRRIEDDSIYYILRGIEE